MNKYKPYVKKYWYSFLLGPFFMVLEACGEFILPFINANIIDKGAANGDIDYILQNGLLMLLLAILMMITGVLGANFAVRGSARLAAGVRRDTFKKIQTFSFSNIDEFTTGSLITRITNDITQIQNFTQTLLRGMFRSPIMLIGALVMSFLLNPTLAWILLAVVPVLGIAIWLIIRVASPRYTQMQEQLDALNIDIRETITNERVIKSFVREEYHKEKFSTVNHTLMEKSTRALKMMLLLQPISALAINVTTLAVVWVAGRQIMVDSMELGTLTAFITYLSQVLTALGFLANVILQGTRAAASDRRIGAVLAAEVSLDDRNVTDPEAQVASGAISMRDVTFRYFKDNEEAVLSHVDLDIESGALVGLIGSTGSGKTTLVSLIPRLYDCDEGAVLVDGKNVQEWPLKHLRDSVSVVLQKNTLFSGTIGENLRWGNEQATD
ncbi:MAG: ABC transporter ATP-binding protein, partial [Clostridia bacterium]|nr:ABC transporter ATP-binding protein [Clostridia bacterium]